MKTFSNVQFLKFTIEKPNFSKKKYHLKNDEDLFGTLEEVSDKQTLAIIETTKDVYTIKRSGFFNPYLTLRLKKLESNLAIAYLNIKGGTVITLDGISYTFKLNNLYKNQWCWLNEKNQILVTIKPIISGIVKADIEISKDAPLYEPIELLTLIGFYMLLKYQNEIEN